MALALVTATAVEMAALLEGLGLSGPAPDQAAWRYETIQGRECALLVTGIGPINAAWSLGRLLGSEPELKGVLNFGVAGAFDLERLPLRSVALVEREIWPEYGLWGEEGLDPRGLKFCLAKGPEGAIWDRIELAPLASLRRMGLEPWPELARVSTLTVSGVTGTKTRKELLVAQYAADLENMEGFALALGCLQADLPFAEIRAVSNLVGARPPVAWDLKGALRSLGGAASRILAAV